MVKNLKQVVIGLCVMLGSSSLVFAEEPAYTVTAYFTISKQVDYTLQWKNIFMNLAKGQGMANKLADLIKQNYKDASFSTASYSGQTITITMTTPPPDPYANAYDVSTCKSLTQ
jgi:hypothetical protein